MSRDQEAVVIRDGQAAADCEVFSTLCREYAESLQETIGASLDYQGFESEMRTLPGKYAAPGGCMLVAWVGSRPAGCVALRPMDEPGVCEMKRMFIRSEFRGRGIGHALGEAVVRVAKRAGYKVMRLDTDHTMLAAIRVYSKLGFQPRERYNDDPCPCTLWFELAL